MASSNAKPNVAGVSTKEISGPSMNLSNMLKDDDDSESSGSVETSKEVTIVVEKAPLEVSVENVSRLTYQENPEFEISYDGFVNTEAVNDLISIAVAVTDATVSSRSGTYPIILEGATSNNYKIKD